MTNIPFARSIYRRGVAKIASIALRNRYYESNPVLNDGEEPASLLSRARLQKIAEIGQGHGRFSFSEPGTFGDDLFVVSGLHLYRMDRYGAVTTIGQISVDILGSVSMTATGNIGDSVPQYLFITDGALFWVYTENGSAIGHLEASGAIADNDVVVIGGVYYKFTTGDVNAGPPDGTAGLPWLVARTGVTATDLGNLYDAINGGEGAGTAYSTDAIPHPQVAANVVTAGDLYVVAREAGTDGNAITTTTTGANLDWDAATLANGGADQLRQVGMPGDVGAISVAHFNSYVIVIPAQGEGVNGRFYWIEPGETYVDPLNYATAERAPDPVNDVLPLSDRFWLLGDNSTEAWVTSTDPLAPMQRMTGILYEQGAIQGTALRVGNSIILVGDNGGVFQIEGGIRDLSRPDIAEMIREGISLQKLMTP